MPIKKKQTLKKQRPLTIKQRKFIDEVVISWNATDAASKVYKVKNRNVANAIWAENLAKPSIKASIEERLKKCKDEMYLLAFTADKDSDRIKALQDTIDRIEWKALARTQHSWEILILSEDELWD